MRSETRAAWTWAIHEFLEWSASEGYPATTRTTRRQHLGLLAEAMTAGPWEVSAEDLASYFRGLEVAANTYRARRTTARAFYRWAMSEGKVAAAPTGKIPRGEVPQPNPMPAPDWVVREAIAKASPRERLMIFLAEGHGMRRAEVAQVHPGRDMFEDLDGWSLIVHGKGGKDRTVPLRPALASALRLLGPGYAFPGRIDGHLSAAYVGKVIARVMPEQWTMHKLRHRAATRWYEECEDLLVVGELLGHANPTTTALYVKRNRRKMRAVVEAGRMVG